MRDNQRRFWPAMMLSIAAVFAAWWRLRPRPTRSVERLPALPAPAPQVVTPVSVAPAATPVTPPVTSAAPAASAVIEATVWFIPASAVCAAAAVVVGTAQQTVFHALTPIFIAAVVGMLGIWLSVTTWLKQNPARQWPRWPWRFTGLGAAMVVAFIAADLNYNAAAEDLSLQVGSTLLWLAAVVLAFASAWQRHDRVAAGVADQPIARWEVIVLIALLIFAFAVRFIDLEHIPRMMLGDETKYGVAARELVDLRQVKPFTTGSDGHWNFYLQIIGLFIQLFGSTLTALRLPSVLAGMLSLIATWAVVRQLWNRRAALIAVALLAAFHHHIHFSRVGFNSIDDPLFSMLAFACVWLAWRTGRRRAWLMAALATGLSQYFFVGGRLVLIQLAVLAVFWLLSKPHRVREQALNIAVAVTAFVVMVTPIVYFMAVSPDDYMSSLNTKNIYRSGWMTITMELTQQSETAVLWGQVRDVVTSFTFGSDEAFYWNQTILTPLMTILAVIGLGYCVAHLREDRYFWLLSALALLILFGGILMVSPSAGSHRLLGSGPLIYAAIAVILDRAWRWAEQHVRWPKLIALAGVIAVALLMVADARTYFVDYLTKNELHSPDIPLNLIHRYILDIDARTAPQPIRLACVGLNADYCHGTNLVYLAQPFLARADIVTDLPSVADVQPPDNRPLFVIVNASLTTEVQQAEQRYPGAVRRNFDDNFGNPLYAVFEVAPLSP